MLQSSSSLNVPKAHGSSTIKPVNTSSNYRLSNLCQQDRKCSSASIQLHSSSSLNIPKARGSSTNVPRCTFSSYTGVSNAGPQERKCQSASIPRSIKASCIGSSTTTTPGTATLKASQDHVILSLVEGRGVAEGEVGIAAINIKCPTLLLSQFSDSASYSRTLSSICLHSPTEIIVPHSVCELGKITRMFHILSEKFEKIPFVTVKRRYFNETCGLQYIHQLCHQEFNKAIHEVQGKYYCLAACAALLKYVEFAYGISIVSGSLKVICSGSIQSMMIDTTSVRDLELLENSRDPDNSSSTLLGHLNRTKTVAGLRALRANILQPPCDVGTINERLDAIAELSECPELFLALQSLLDRILSIDNLLTVCVQINRQSSNLRNAETKIANILYLKHVIQLIPTFREHLQGLSSSIFCTYAHVLSSSDFESILSKVDKVIHPEISYQKGILNMKTQRCFAIKQGVNGLLDIARKLYTEQVNDISRMVKALSEEEGIPLRVSYNDRRGFYIQVLRSQLPSGKLKRLPHTFIKVREQRHLISCTTHNLVKINERLKESLSEVYLIGDIVLSELFNDIVSHIGILYKLSEIIGMVDMLVSLAQIANMHRYIRPEFTSVLAVRRGRHPILETVSRHPTVPNHIYLTEDSNFIIITGPNMSGKSTYSRQIALLQIMAQMGGFVPAEQASFRVADGLFTRIGNEDDLERNASTFTVEMNEMHHILESVTKSSLVILDELGRVTNDDDGLSLCFSMSEVLSQTKAFCILTTHFREVTFLEQMYINIDNCHFDFITAGSSQPNTIDFTYVLKKGPSDVLNYGLKTARMCPLPTSILDRAESIVRSGPTYDKEKLKNKGKVKAILRLFKKICAFHEVWTASKSIENLRSYLYSVKLEYFKNVSYSTELS